MQVNDATKNAYKSGRGRNSLRIYFPDLDLTVPASSIVKESMTLKEAVSESKDIEFVGCIASQFQIRVHGISDDLKNERVQVFITSGNTQEIALFNGIVDSAQMETNKNYKAISAFDELYTAGQNDIASWYNGLTFPITIGAFRNSLFAHLGITQVITHLPADGIEIEKQYSPTKLEALPVIKSICQLNCVFGIINREGKFEYRIPNSSSATENLEPYKTIDYQEYTVKPVDRLTIRQTDQDEGVSYGEGENTYIIQGNFFTLNLSEEVLNDIAESIYGNIEGFSYIPFSSKGIALPWVECAQGTVSCEVYDFGNSSSGSAFYKPMSFSVLARKLTGIQALRDSFSAEGDEFQRVFVTDLQSRVETIIERISEITGRLEDYSLSYVSYSNANKIVIADGDEVTTWKAVFTVRKPTQVMVNIEYLLDCETKVEGYNFYDLVLEVNYYYDRVLIDTRKPTETYVDGKHILKLYYLLNVDRYEIQHMFEVRLIANGGTVTIGIGQGLHTLVGQGLDGDIWDGTFDITQVINRMTLDHPRGITTRSFGSTVMVNTQQPIPNMIEQEMPVIELGSPHGLLMRGVSDGLLVDFTEA